MTELSQFTAEEIEAIVSLPYRAGIHVSYAEDEDGEKDDEHEMAALEASIIEVAKLHEGCALSQEIAKNILSSKDKWDSWTQGVFNIEPLCEKAVATLGAKANHDEVRSYVKMIIEIVTAVAQAYGEFDEDPEPEKGFFGKVMGAIVGGISQDDASHPMNVSAAEDDAISRIRSALKKNMA